MAGNPRIAPTAHYTAQQWVREGFPNADYFDTATGRVLHRALDIASKLLAPLGVPSIANYNHYLALRHYAFEARLRELDPPAIVEIGAGLSPRGLTFARENSNRPFYEFDLPLLVQAKRERLQHVSLPANYFLGTCDLLSPRFAESMPILPTGSVVVTEGVFDYLSFDEKTIALGNIARLLQNGGRYLLEIHPLEITDQFGPAAQFMKWSLSALVRRPIGDRLFATTRETLVAICSAGFADARVLSLRTLNQSPYDLPLERCPWQLVEAQI